MACAPESRLVPETVSLGPRPFYLLDQLHQGPLRTKLDAILDIESSLEAKAQMRHYIDSLRQACVRTVASPVSMLHTLDNTNEIFATEFAKALGVAGIEIVAWTLERSGRIQD